MKQLLIILALVFGSTSWLAAQQDFHKRTRMQMINQLSKIYRTPAFVDYNLKFSLMESEETTKEGTYTDRFATVEVFERPGLIRPTTHRITLTNSLTSVFPSDLNDPNFVLGPLVLTAEDMAAIGAFQADTRSLVGKVPEEPNRPTILALEVMPRFRVAYVYNPEHNPKWEFYLFVDGFEFEIRVGEGALLLNELANMGTQMQ